MCAHAHLQVPLCAMVNRRRTVAAESWGAMLSLHAALVPAIDRRLRREGGLPLVWYDVLLELAHGDDRRLRMSALADRVVLSRTRVSRIVDELVAEGLVVRQANLDDARSAYAALTDEGERRFRTTAPKYLAAIEEMFAATLSDDDLAQLGTLLRRILDHTTS